MRKFDRNLRPRMAAMPQTMRAFLLGFLLVALPVVVVVVVVADFPNEIAESARLEEMRKGAARGQYIAERDAKDFVTKIDPRRVQEDIETLLWSIDPDDGYRRAYRFAWNDAINTLSRRVPSQLLADEERTQWIELLR